MKIKDIANYYLKKHSINEDLFGLGPFIDSYPFEAYAAPKEGAGGLIISSADNQLQSVYSDCKSMAKRLKDDIAKENPQLNPEIKKNGGRGFHYWVEITDPATFKKIQIDPTPWFRDSNPDHMGNELKEHENVDEVILSQKIGRPFSISKKNLFNSVYILGFFRRIFERQMQNRNIESFPVCTFRLFAVIEKYFAAPPERSLGIVFAITEIDKFETVISSIRKVDDLITENIIKAGITFPKNNTFENIYFNSLEEIEEESKKRGTYDLFKVIESSLPRLLLIIKKIKRKMPVYGKQNEYADIKTGEYA